MAALFRHRVPPSAIVGAFAAIALSAPGAHAAPSTSPPPASAQSRASPASRASLALPTPLDDLAPNLADAFSGSNLFYFAGALAATDAMAFGGGDQAIRVGTQRSLSVPAYSVGAYYAGYTLPTIVAPAIYIWGLLARDRARAGAGSAAIQAVVITAGATQLFKWATGRPYPLNGGDPHAPDRLNHPEYAGEFRPFGGGDAWPSGHTSVSISVAAALTAYYPDTPAVPLIGYPLALAIGIGMVDGDRHWASDVVAGALIGHAVGYSIGANFRRRARCGGRAPDQARVWIVPLSGGAYGLAAGGEW